MAIARQYMINEPSLKMLFSYMAAESVYVFDSLPHVDP